MVQILLLHLLRSDIFWTDILLDSRIHPIQSGKLTLSLVKSRQTDKLSFHFRLINRVASLDQRVYFYCFFVFDQLFADRVYKIFSFFFLLEISYHFPLCKLIVFVTLIYPFEVCRLQIETTVYLRAKSIFILTCWRFMDEWSRHTRFQWILVLLIVNRLHLA